MEVVVRQQLLEKKNKKKTQVALYDSQENSFLYSKKNMHYVMLHLCVELTGLKDAQIAGKNLFLGVRAFPEEIDV